MKDLGIYIHIPFCLRRCNYCGFYSQGLNAFGDEDGTRHAENQYVQWLIGQIRERGAELRRKYTVDTVFVGGGTPSILSAEAMEAILTEEKPNQKEKISIPYASVKRYIPSSVPPDKTGDFILKALEYYHRHLERQRNDAR